MGYVNSHHSSGIVDNDYDDLSSSINSPTSIIENYSTTTSSFLSSSLVSSTVTETSVLGAAAAAATAESSNSDKLFKSINLLKNIIEKISQSRVDSGKSSSSSSSSSGTSYNKGNSFLTDYSDIGSAALLASNGAESTSGGSSLNQLYALAHNSVTLSYKDYVLMQTTTTANVNSQLGLESSLLSSTMSPVTSTGRVVASNLAEMFAFMNRTYNQSLSSSSTRFPTGELFNSNLSLNSGATMSDSHYTEGFSSSSSSSNNSSLLIFISLFYSILILTSLISNPLLIYILLWRRKAQIKLIDIFVANLSLSDLFLTILNIPLCLIIYFSERWPFGSVLCKLGTFSTSCSIYVNIFTMAYISIDRYFAVTRPLLVSNPRKKSVLLDNQTRQKIYSVLTFIWIISLILSIPQIIFSKVSDDISSSLADAKTLLELEDIDLELEDKNNHTLSHHVLSDINKDLSRLLTIGEDDPFKKCVLEYPYPNMKNYMILVNFLLQYLIPSIVILYFYGKIIYHLYLNLNMDDLMESAPTTTLPVVVNNNHRNNVRHNQYIGGSLSPILSSQHAHQTTTTTTANTSNNNNNKKTKFIFKSKTLYDIDSSAANTTKNGSGSTSSTPNLKRNQLYNASSTIKNAFSTPVAVDMIGEEQTIAATPTPVLVRKQSRAKLRVEGFTRTRNLKKSIKIMIIIIVLFLLSWLPIHVYRLLTTYYPIVQSYFNNKVSRLTTTRSSSSSSSSLSSSLNSIDQQSESVVAKMSEASLINGTLISVLCQMYDKTASSQYRECLLSKWKTLMMTNQRDYKSLFGNGSVNSRHHHYDVYYTANGYDDDDEFKLDTMHNRYAFFVCYFMAMSSVCYNPIVYFWMHKKFRAEVKLLFLNICYALRCGKNRNKKKNNSVSIGAAGGRGGPNGGRCNRGGPLQTSLLTSSSTTTTTTNRTRRDSRSWLNSSQTTSSSARKNSNNSLIMTRSAVRRNSPDITTSTPMNRMAPLLTRSSIASSSQSSGHSLQYTTNRPSGIRHGGKLSYLDYLKRSRRGGGGGQREEYDDEHYGP